MRPSAYPVGSARTAHRAVTIGAIVKLAIAASPISGTENIDRQLASPFGRDRNRYTQPPFEEGVPEQGYQGKATPREIYREGIALLGREFDRLTPDQQDAKLRSIETTYFFHLLRQNTIEGMFCDPMHGGNADLIGWQLIGYPGPYMSWADHIDQHYNKPFRPTPRSLSDVLGRKVKPWEDEA